MLEGLSFLSNIIEITAHRHNSPANPAIINPHQIGKGVYVMVSKPNPTHGNIRNKVQSKCVRFAVWR